MEAHTPLAERRCVPCHSGTRPLAGDALLRLKAGLGDGWRIVDGHHLEVTFKFPDFAQGLAFVNRVGALAEEADHHPDLSLSWGKVGITLWTHRVNGLTENDFILAARIERLVSESSG